MTKSNQAGFRLSIKHHLVMLVLVAVIPLMLFATGLVKYLSEEGSQTLEVNLLGTTKALRAAVDEQIISMSSSLTMLGEVEDFGPSRIEYLHTQLRHFVENHPGWDSISFTDTDGVQVFNTASAYGKKLPSLKKEEFFRETLKTKATVISGYRVGSVTQEPIISVATPVMRDQTVIYVLVASMKLKSFSRFFRSHNLPSAWTATILDEHGRVLATSDTSLTPGNIAGPELTKKTKQHGSKIFYNPEGEGKKVLGSTSQSKLTGWTIVLGLPDEGNLFSYQKTVKLIMIGGALLTLMSIFFALYLGRRISKPILAISESAKALGEGKALGEIKTSLAEAHDVNQALKLAAIERGENEEKIKALYGQAQEAVAIRDTFMSVASHELKTPLTTLKLQFQMLDRLMTKKETLTREELSKPLSRIQGQYSRLLRLVDDLLDVSRISSGKMDYHPEVFDLVSFTDEILHQFADETKKSGSEISLVGVDKLTGNWDKHRLEQVIVNLITNSIKYGNGKPVSLSILEENNSAILEVKDNGLGISAEDLPKVFQKFERVGDRRKAQGLGLGLWIVQKIVEGLGGSITVTSTLGEGSAFKLTLPLVQVQMDAAEIVSLNLSATKTENQMGNQTTH